MSLNKKGKQIRENNRPLLIEKEWIISLKNVLISFLGLETSSMLFFEHGRTIGRTIFHQIRETVQNQLNSSRENLNRFCEWLGRSGFCNLEISNHEFSKKCMCRITNYLEELRSYYCGLLTGLLECLWDKEISVKCVQESLGGSFELILLVKDDDRVDRN